MQSKQAKNLHYDALIVSFIFMAIPMAIILASRFVVIPLSKWLGKKLWTAIKARNSSQATKQPKQRKQAPATNDLPTPDIFKGAPNLAPMKDFRF